MPELSDEEMLATADAMFFEYDQGWTEPHSKSGC